MGIDIYRKNKKSTIESKKMAKYLPTIAKVLMPVDGSDSCHSAEEVAVSIAKKFKSKVTVLHVVSHEFLNTDIVERYKFSPSVQQEITNVFLEKGKKIIVEAEYFFKSEKVDVDTKLVEYSDPAETILEVAGEGNCNLIVMGNRGESEAEVFSLGSVAEKVLRYSERPVLIVKKGTGFSKILVGIDSSQKAVEVLEYAVQFGVKYKSKITLLNVQQLNIFNLKPKETEEIGRRVLSDIAAKVEGVEFDEKLDFGTPAEAIIQVAEEGDYDLVVVGSRGLSGVKRFLLGSTSDDVSHHATCSVLVVK